MLFNSFPFAVFFVLVLVAYHGLPAHQRARLLLVASLVFYTLWIPAYLLLLLLDVLVNYRLLRMIATSPRPGVPLAISCGFTLGLLGVFKYAAFAVETAAPWLAGLGFQASVPEVLLPLGISFYSFQIIALAVDTYRGQVEPVDSLERYALFVSFFPQLIAGPILRGHQFLPQLDRGGQLTAERARRGLWLIAVGLTKKVVFADYLLAPFVDEAFKPHAPATPAFHWLGAYSFAFQIYFDFSGYTDMARGMALLLGFELPMNFKEPYLSRSPVEHWRRWHITLSSWLSDYLYVPLGGNRRGRARTWLNLLLTMLLGGLWHGASWSFVAWGALLGAFLVVHRVVARRRVDVEAPIRVVDWPKIFVVFHVWVISMVLFRAETLTHAIDYLRVMARTTDPYPWPWLQTGIVLLCAGLHPLERYARLRAPALRERLGAWGGGRLVEGMAWGAVVGVVVMVSGIGGDFIYFQF